MASMDLLKFSEVEHLLGDRMQFYLLWNICHLNSFNWFVNRPTLHLWSFSFDKGNMGSMNSLNAGWLYISTAVTQQNYKPAMMEVILSKRESNGCAQLFMHYVWLR
mgnify:CR=1 FL=1